MEPAGSTYWLDNTYLDWGHDDYYAHSGNWWDVQDSPWLTHLNEPSYTLTITQGVGVASVVSDEPGLVCSPATSCATSWQSGSLIVLMSAAAPGFSRAVWGGGCAAAGNVPECDLTVDADTNVTLSYLRTLAAGHFSAGFVRRPSRIQATLTLNRPPAAGEASLTCGGLAGLRLASHTITHVVATCIWNVPRRFAGRRVQGRLRIGLDDGRVLAHAFTVHLPPLV